MNIDDLRNQWNNEGEQLKSISESQLKQKTAHPIEELKKKIKNEYIFQLLGLLFAAFVPFIGNFESFYANVYYVIFAITLIISLYYFKGFYDFYKRLDRFEGNTQFALWEIYYDLKIQIERYKSFGFLLIPMVWIVLLLFTLKDSTQTLNSQSIYLYLGISIFMSLILIILIVFWADLIYGKTVKKLYQIIRQFEV